jgi:hypothetical protein
VMGGTSPGWNPEGGGELIRAGREGSINDALAESIGKTLEECIPRLTFIGPSRAPSGLGVTHGEDDNQVPQAAPEGLNVAPSAEFPDGRRAVGK